MPYVKGGADNYHNDPVGNELLVVIEDDDIATAMIQDEAVTPAKLAPGIVDLALVSGDSTAITKTSAGVITLLPASSVSRVVQIVGKVTEVFANGAGAQTVVKIGETDSDDKFVATTILVNAANGSQWSWSGVISATKALIATVTAATSTGTGGITLESIAVTGS